MLWPSSGVFDCSHTFIVKYDHYAFELYIVEIPPVVQPLSKRVCKRLSKRLSRVVAFIIDLPVVARKLTSVGRRYTVRPRKKTDPWNKGMLWPSSGVYDCSLTFIVKYDHYAFESYIVEIPPVMHHWAALFSKLNVQIHLFHFKIGR